MDLLAMILKDRHAIREEQHNRTITYGQDILATSATNHSRSKKVRFLGNSVNVATSSLTNICMDRFT